MFALNYVVGFSNNEKNISSIEEIDINQKKAKSSRYDRKNEEETSDIVTEDKNIAVNEEFEQIDIEECKDLLNLVGYMLDVYYQNSLNSNERDSTTIDMINCICNGDKDYILKLIGFNEGTGDTIPRLPSSFERMFCNIHAADVCLTIEQANEIAYSLSGIENLFDNYAEEDHIPLGTGCGFGGGYYLQNPSAEYIGNNSWNIKADVYYSNEFSEIPYYYIADISFQIVRDEKSCYDGYRVIGIQTFQTCNWNECFYNYLIKNEYYASESDGINDYDLRYDIKPYYLFHLDNDGIPEIFVEGLYAADGARILYYCNDNVYEQQLLAGFSSFAPEKGILLDSYGKMESYVDTILQLKDGNVKIIGEGHFSFNIDEDVNPVLDANGNIIYLEGSQWNDKAVTDSGQYNELYNITLSEFNVDKDECRSCIDAEFFIGDIDCMLFALSE